MTHVLVTRPREASQQLADQLQSHGFSPIVLPLYTFSALQPSFDVSSAWSTPKKRNLATPNLAVFTSPRAVEFGLSHIPPERLDDLEFAVVGSATRLMLESSGYSVHLQAKSGFTSEDLLQMPELAAEPGDAVIFCAPGGRETLAEGLADLGWNVDKAMVYERVPLQPDPGQLDALSGADDLLSIWTSISALKLAEKHLPEELWKKILDAPALVISARIQHHLQLLGAACVELADGPGNTELLQSIINRPRDGRPKMDNKQLNEVTDEVTTDPVDKLLQEKKPPSSGKAIAILALLVSMAAVSATGWQWWQMRQDDPGEATLQQSITGLQDAQQRLAASVASFEAQLDAAESPIDAAEFSRRDERLKAAENQLVGLQGQSGEDQASISSVQGSVRSLEQRLSATESGLVSVAANSQNSSVELNIAEIDFLLRAASERLQLFSDPSAADLALQAADVQIEALNDPMFLSVRQRIASSRQALATVPRIDRVQLSAQLNDMQSRVPGLPFRGEVEAQPEAELPEEAGWWESFKRTMASLVTVRRRAPEDQSLLSLDDKDYLRQGLWLQLESARLALMRSDTGAYAGSLDRVNDTLEQFFKNGSSEVKALSAEIEALKQVDIAPEMPDISAPWTQLRQLRDSRRLLQSASPVDSPVESEEPVE